MDGATASPLTTLERLLDHLQRVVQSKEAEGLDATIGAHLADATEAAMAAAGRARDNGVRGGAPQISEALSVANALLAELEEPSALDRTRALVSRSMDLRRQALRLTAAALALRRQSQQLRGRNDWAARADPLGALHGVRVLLVAGSGAQADDLTLQLSALGAEACTVETLDQALRDGLAFRPDVLLCDVPFPAAEGLVLEMRRGGVIAPALAATSSDDSGARTAARAAGFAGVLMRPITLADLTRAIRASLGA